MRDLRAGPGPSKELQHRVAIVGAGVAGVASARSLQVRGIEFEVFEQREAIGGLWTEAYPNACTQVCSYTLMNLLYTCFNSRPGVMRCIASLRLSISCGQGTRTCRTCAPCLRLGLTAPGGVDRPSRSDMKNY